MPEGHRKASERRRAARRTALEPEFRESAWPVESLRRWRLTNLKRVRESIDGARTKVAVHRACFEIRVVVLSLSRALPPPVHGALETEEIDEGDNPFGEFHPALPHTYRKLAEPMFCTTVEPWVASLLRLDEQKWQAGSIDPLVGKERHRFFGRDSPAE